MLSNMTQDALVVYGLVCWVYLSALRQIRFAVLPKRVKNLGVTRAVKIFFRVLNISIGDDNTLSKLYIWKCLHRLYLSLL